MMHSAMLPADVRKISDLALRWAVANILHPGEVYIKTVEDQIAMIDRNSFATSEYEYLVSTLTPKIRIGKDVAVANYESSWTHTGPLLDRFDIELRSVTIPAPVWGREPNTGRVYAHVVGHDCPATGEIWLPGDTRLQAICRAVVASTLDPDVYPQINIPRELMSVSTTMYPPTEVSTVVFYPTYDSIPSGDTK